MDDPKTLKIEELPSKIRSKITSVCNEVDAIIEKANKVIKTALPPETYFEFVHSAPTDVLSTFERAQSVCFIIKYENLTEYADNIDLVQYNGNYYLRNFEVLGHILSEYRPIIQNENDSVYYKRIQTFCRSKLTNHDSSMGLSVTVKDGNRNVITDVYTNCIDERIKAIGVIIKECEFDYVYNGILQHSDMVYSNRLWEEYANGIINYVFLKHTMVLKSIKEYLRLHYHMINVLTYPKLGPL